MATWASTEPHRRNARAGPGAGEWYRAQSHAYAELTRSTMPDFSGATGRSRHAEEDRQEAELRQLEDGLVLSAFDDESVLPPLVSTDRSSLSGDLPGSPPRGGSERYSPAADEAEHEAAQTAGAGSHSRPTTLAAPNRATRAAALFRELDVDESGALTKAEIANIAAALGHRWRKAQLDAHFTRMLSLEVIYGRHVRQGSKMLGPGGEPSDQSQAEDGGSVTEPSVSLVAFLQWWRTHHRGLAHAAMQRCAAIFDELDPYSARTLNESCAEELRLTLLAEHPWIDFGGAGEMLRFENLPKRTSTTLTREQYPGVHHGTLVTREQLLAYYKAQLGAEPVELPVFPEHLTSQIEEAAQCRIKPGDEIVCDGGRPPQRVQSADKLRTELNKAAGSGDRRGRQLWKFLMPRLTVLVKFSKLWGQLHELNPNAEELLQAKHSGAEDPSEEEEPQLPRFMWHSEGTFTIHWRRFQAIALIYIVITAPIAIGFELPVRSPAEALWWVELLIDLHFLVDIPLRFRTTFYDSRNGLLVDDSAKIVQRYLRTWFAVDVLSVLPFSYLALESEDSPKSTLLTQVRCIKALRLIRLPAWSRSIVSTSIRSMVGAQWILVISKAAIVATVLHIMSCGWWLVGTDEDRWGNTTASLWSDGTFATSLGAKYVQAVYGVIVERGTAARTTHQHLFAIAIEITLVLLQIYLTAVAVRIMTQPSNNTGSAVSDALSVSAVSEWARARGLSRPRAAEIEECYRRLYHADKGNLWLEARVMAELPAPVATKLAEDLYLVYIRRLPLFRGLSSPVLGAVCRVVIPREIGQGTTVYSEGDSGTELYVILNGEVEVEAGGERLGFLGEGGFFGETGVIEAAANKSAVEAVRTRTIRATLKTELGMIPRKSVVHLMVDYPELQARLSSFANLGRAPLHSTSTKRADAVRWRHELMLRELNTSHSSEMAAMDGGPASIETLRADRLLLRTRIDKMEENQSRQLADTLRIVNKMRSDQLGNKNQIDSIRIEMVEMISKIDCFIKSFYMKMGRTHRESVRSPT